MATATAIHNIGRVVQVIGPVLDVEFEAEHLPELYNALEIIAKGEDGSDIRVVSEVQQHIGRNQVRAVGMSSKKPSNIRSICPVNCAHGAQTSDMHASMTKILLS